MLDESTIAKSQADELSSNILLTFGPNTLSSVSATFFCGKGPMCPAALKLIKLNTLANCVLKHHEKIVIEHCKLTDEELAIGAAKVALLPSLYEPKLSFLPELGAVSAQATFLYKSVTTKTHGTRNKLFDTYVHALLAGEFSNKSGFFEYAELYKVSEKFGISYRKLIQAVNSLKNIGVITKAKKWHVKSVKAIALRARTLTCTFDVYCGAIAAKAYSASLWFFNAIKEGKSIARQTSNKEREKLVLAFKSGDEYKNWSRSKFHGPCALSNIARTLQISIPSAWRITRLAKAFGFISLQINKRECSAYDSFAFYSKYKSAYYCYKASTISLLS